MELQENVIAQLRVILLNRYGIADLVSPEELREIWGWVSDRVEKDFFLEEMAAICARKHYGLSLHATDEALMGLISAAARSRYNLCASTSSEVLLDAIVHASGCMVLGLPADTTPTQLEVARLEKARFMSFGSAKKRR